MTIASNLSFLQNSAGAITTGTVNAIGSPITFSVNNTEYNRIDTNGYSLLGYTSSQGSYKLQVNGNVLINGTLSLTTASIGNITGSVTTASNIAGGTTGQLHYQTGVGLTGFVGPGTSGQILVSAGASAPVYTNTASIYVNSARYSDNITAGTTGQLVYQSAANTTGFVGPGTSGQLLVSAGASAPVYTTTSTIQVGYSANVLGGAAGGIVYQSGANASTFLSIGTAGQFLSVNAGATAPTYVSTSTMYVQRAVQADSAAGSAGSTTGALTAGTGLTSSGGTFNGSTNLTFSLNTATLMASAVTALSVPATNLTGTINNAQLNGGTYTINITGNASTATAAAVAYSTIGTHTAGTGLSGTAFNGSANQTWTLNTATLMASSVAIAGGTTGQLVYQSAANTTGFVGPGTAGQFLQSAGAGAPTYVSTGTMYVQRAVLADSVTGSAGSLVNALTIGTGLSGSPSTTYNGSAAITVTLNTATLMASATQVVQSHSTGTGILGGSYNGSTAVTWSLNTATLMASSVAISGGTSGQLVYQSAANTTGFVGPGTAGQFLQSAGTSAPTYVSTTTMYVQRAVQADSASAGAGYTGNINATANTNAFEYIVGVSASGSTSAAATVATSNPVGFNASSGNVGIGTSSPGYKLDVNGVGNLATGMQVGSTSGLSYGASKWMIQGESSSLTRSYACGPDGSTYGSWEHYTAYSTGTPVSVMRWDANGRVGIGTSSPAAKFHVVAGSATSLGTLPSGTSVIVDGSSNNFLTFRNTADNGTYAGIVMQDNNIGGYVLYGNAGGGGDQIYISGYGGGQLMYGTSDTTTPSNRTAALAWNSNGAISFNGTSNYGSSGQLLQSNGNAAPTWVNASGVSAGSATNATNVYQTTDPSSGTYRLLLGNASNTNGSVYNKTALYWNDSGSIIQGANISGNAASATTLANFTAATSSNGLSADTPNTINDIGYVSGNISLYANGSAGSQSDGGLYVAGYSTSWYHQIYGDFRTGSISVRGKNSGTWQAWRSIPTIAVSDTAPSIYNSGDLWWQSSTGRLKIRYFDGTNGQWVDAVPVIDTSLFFSKSGGAISGPVSINGALSVTGNITATAEITAYYSDRRLKTDIVTIENALVKVKKLNGVTYRPNEIAKSFGLDTDSDVVGLFADEVEQVLPQAVKPAPFDLDENGNSKSGENYKTIQYEKVVPLLVEAIKDQQKIIEEQQSKIDLLMKHLGL
jgi:hypothetical protein